MLGSERQLWSHLSDKPTIVTSGARAGWRGFAFQEIEVPPEGRFDIHQAFIALSMTCGPMKVRRGSARAAFVDVPTDPLMMLPGQEAVGAWQGVQRGLHLVIEPDAIERYIGRSYREGAFRRLQGTEPTIEHLLRALHIDVRAGHPSGAGLGEAIVTALLHHLLTEDAVSAPTAAHQPAAPADVKRLQEWIEANLARPITLHELANERGVSIRHLCRAFQAGTGHSPYRYILIRRVERAKELISEGQLNLRDIAATVGFAHQAHMTDTFRKIAEGFRLA
ncbi:transcriptional regulator, AraC family protein [Methylorubrum populi]|uniref:Transcriptional regulator, AraC family protein n=1 Tax=Methylorubrum populi TaxID=223967 RepID=A0A160PF12_9HYPH|nr:AraC family transcriptional regulator [Methylorubrum populi]BAU89940.1 transcriptional regulator, AraC family protein [Methylorubrum populi]